tara:strand:+ start:1651 stop:2037 length:387 start_codon:yes stop_codon:yes gene_type:complete
MSYFYKVNQKDVVLMETKQTILFLSESSLFLEFARECFSQEGHDFFDFASWSDCELQVSDLSPTLLLLDFDNYENPDEDLDKIARFPVVGLYSDESARDLSNLNLKGLIRKPIAVHELVPKCLSFLSK